MGYLVFSATQLLWAAGQRQSRNLQMDTAARSRELQQQMQAAFDLAFELSPCTARIWTLLPATLTW